MDRIYQGTRDRRGIPEVWVLDSTTRVSLHQQLVLTDPDIEFDWGFPCKDSRDLALSLLADALEGGDHPLVDELYERLDEILISRLPADGWQIRQSRLVDWAFGRAQDVPVEPLPLDALRGGIVPGFN